MLSRVFGVLLTVSLASGFAWSAQQQQRQPPSADRPAPRAPAPDRATIVRGRVALDFAGRQLEHPIMVRLEGLGANLVATAFTNSIGDFIFQDIRPGEEYFLVVDEEGFRPVRERLDSTSMGFHDMTIFLRPEEPRNLDEGVDGAYPAVVDLRQLEVTIPEEAMEEYERAREDSADGDHEEAAERLERAIRLAPDFYRAQNDLGMAYLNLGRYEDADGPLKRASELNPNGAAPRINQGLLYLQMGDARKESGDVDEAMQFAEGAIAVLEEAILLDPLSAPAQYYLGSALYRTRSHERAESALNRALELDREMNEVRLMLVNVYVAQSLFDQALGQLTDYLVQDPESPQREAIERTKGQLEQLQALQ